MPRMATVGRAIRMGESSQGTQAVRAVAGSAREEGGQSSQEQVASRAVHPHSPGFLEVASSSTTEPCARDRRSRGHRGGSEVGGCSVGPRRGKRPFEASAEGLGSCPSEIPDRTSGQDDRLVQEFPRKRAGRLEEAIARATAKKEVGLQEIVESERRLEQWEAQARVLPSQVDAQVEVSVVVLQEKIDVLQKERDVLLAASTPVLPRPAPVWMGDGPPSLNNIPPLPSANVQGRGILVELPQLRDAERSGTRGCWHCCSLRQFGRTRRSNPGQSLARRPDERPVHVDDGNDQRGRLQEEVRRRRFARWPVTRESRYGMGGCRIGEAFNPGPPGTRIRPGGL